MTSFKKNFSINLRIDEATRICAKYPDRVPVIIEYSEGSDLPQIDKKKYLVPTDLTFGQFIYVIRKNINLRSNQGLFSFVGDKIPNISIMMGELYDYYKDIDGFLYVVLSTESTFG
jgi:GABA(A) receptor-associated protein